MSLVMIGLSEIAIAMADPFGEDQADFNLEAFLQQVYDNAVGFLTDDRSVHCVGLPEGMDNPLHAQNAHLRRWGNDTANGLIDRRVTPPTSLRESREPPSPGAALTQPSADLLAEALQSTAVSSEGRPDLDACDASNVAVASIEAGMPAEPMASSSSAAHGMGAGASAERSALRDGVRKHAGQGGAGKRGGANSSSGGRASSPARSSGNAAASGRKTVGTAAAGAARAAVSRGAGLLSPGRASSPNAPPREKGYARLDEATN